MEGGLNIGVKNGIQRQLKARSSLGPYWTPFVLTALQLKITDIGQLFVACPALQAPMQEGHDQWRQSATQGLQSV